MPNDSSCGTKTCESETNKNKFIRGLKFSSININSIRGKKLELLAFLDLHQLQIVAIQETKIDSAISTSELFQETCPYNVNRKDRTLDGGGVMLLIHKDIPHMPIAELENSSESVWLKVFANKTSHSVVSWYRPPDSKVDELELFKINLKRLKRYIMKTNLTQSLSWGIERYLGVQNNRTCVRHEKRIVQLWNSWEDN